MRKFTIFLITFLLIFSSVNSQAKSLKESILSMLANHPGLKQLKRAAQDMNNKQNKNSKQTRESMLKKFEVFDGFGKKYREQLFREKLRTGVYSIKEYESIATLQTAEAYFTLLKIQQKIQIIRYLQRRYDIIKDKTVTQCPTTNVNHLTVYQTNDLINEVNNAKNKLTEELKAAFNNLRYFVVDIDPNSTFYRPEINYEITSSFNQALFTTLSSFNNSSKSFETSNLNPRSKSFEIDYNKLTTNEKKLKDRLKSAFESYKILKVKSFQTTANYNILQRKLLNLFDANCNTNLDDFYITEQAYFLALLELVDAQHEVIERKLYLLQSMGIITHVLTQYTHNSTKLKRDEIADWPRVIDFLVEQSGEIMLEKVQIHLEEEKKELEDTEIHTEFRCFAVNATKLYIRTEPDKSGKIVDSFLQGEVICGKQMHGDWLKTEKGWSSVKFLEEIK
jgi:hypothetical protein